MSNGHYFDLTNPDDAIYGAEEIAHALSMLCRFSGHCKDFYSVAQHSVYVSLLVAPPFALDGLFHDASEAFMGDMTTPLKTMMPRYRTMEKDIQASIARRFGMRPVEPSSVKGADLAVLAAERATLLPADNSIWPILDGVEPARIDIQPMTPAEAKTFFLNRYYEIQRSNIAYLNSR